MWKEIVGVVVGVGIGIGLVKVLHDRRKEERKDFVEVDMKNNVENKLKDFSGLLQEQLVVETLSGDELAKWFRENAMLDADDINKIIAYPTKQVLNGLSYEFNDELDTKKSIIQVFYNTEKEEILKLRFISFSEIDLKLKDMLEKDGMVVIE